MARDLLVTVGGLLQVAGVLVVLWGVRRAGQQVRDHLGAAGNIEGFVQRHPPIGIGSARVYAPWAIEELRQLRVVLGRSLLAEARRAKWGAMSVLLGTTLVMSPNLVSLLKAMLA